MYRIRFHGRGGQGMKTASRVLGSAFFRAGYEVQDAPRYGAERRGAPIFAYVRADRKPIFERGVIRNPDLVIVADDTLVPVPAAGVLQGLDTHTVVLIHSSDDAATWRARLNPTSQIVVLPTDAEGEDRAAVRYVGAACAGAAARLLGVLPRALLLQAMGEELGALGAAVLERNLARAAAAFDAMAPHAGCVHEGVAADACAYAAPAWVDLPLDTSDYAAPVIRAAANSALQATGLWRTLRPEIDYTRCNRCWWVCSTFCPDGAIRVLDDGRPEIDYDHCKGCMVCVAQCPPHAIAAVQEHTVETPMAGGGA